MEASRNDIEDVQKGELLEGALERTRVVIAGVPAGVAEHPTPCPQWPVASLVTHMIGWVNGFETVLRTGSLTVDPEGFTTRADDAAAEYGAAGDRLLHAWRNGDPERTVTLYTSPLPVRFVYPMILGEVVVHGWDLAVATGQPVTWTDAQATFVLDGLRAMMRPEYRGPDKSMGEEVPVPADAPAIDRLLGFTGRDPHWQPPTLRP